MGSTKLFLVYSLSSISFTPSSIYGSLLFCRMSFKGIPSVLATSVFGPCYFLLKWQFLPFLLTITHFTCFLSPSQMSVRWGREAAVMSARWHRVKGSCVPVRRASSWDRTAGHARSWITVPSTYAAAKCANSTRILWNAPAIQAGVLDPMETAVIIQVNTSMMILGWPVVNNLKFSHGN